MQEQHGTAVEWEGTGYLFLGESGAGKSDLALRVIDAGGKLIADDRVEITAREDQILAQAPKLSQGLLEVRGMGIFRLSHHVVHPIHCVVILEPGERLPEPQTYIYEQLKLPCYNLNAQSPSALARLKFIRTLLNGTTTYAC